MAESFEASHIPQQSRRNKLRVIHEENFIDAPSSFSSRRPQPSLPINPNISLNGHDALSLPESSNNYLHQNINFHLNREVRELSHDSGTFSIANGESRSSVPLGPFTGYASILNRSRFLKPAEEVLEGFCGVDKGMKCTSSCTADPSLESLIEIEIAKNSSAFGGRIELRFKNLRLLSLLEEVYKRYKLYCQQMQSVVVSFEAVAGLQNAAPYVFGAFKTMWKHFRCLKNAILDQICLTGKTSPNTSLGQERSPGEHWTDDRGLHGENNSVHNSTFTQQHVSRSQRGLPDQAVAVLRSWLFEHFLHPYPNDLDKQILAQQTGLSKTQVSNWFINARVRLWKPMVMQEMHILERYPPQTTLSKAEKQYVSNLQTDLRLPLGSPLPSQTQLQTTPAPKMTRDTQFKRSRRNELLCVPEQIEDQMWLTCSGLCTNYDNGSWSRGEGNRGISLALGLNQSDGVQKSQPFPNDIASPPLGLGKQQDLRDRGEQWYQSRESVFGGPV